MCLSHPRVTLRIPIDSSTASKHVHMHMHMVSCIFAVLLALSITDTQTHLSGAYTALRPRRPLCTERPFKKHIIPRASVHSDAVCTPWHCTSSVCGSESTAHRSAIPSPATFASGLMRVRKCRVNSVTARVSGTELNMSLKCKYNREIQNHQISCWCWQSLHVNNLSVCNNSSELSTSTWLD